MNVTLNLYKTRSEEILRTCCDEKKFAKYDGEYKNMILFLECTVKKIKGDRAKFWKTHDKNLNSNEPKTIHYNKETNQYFCNIDGIKLRGNVGNVYDRKILQNDRIKAHQVVPCRGGNSCRNVLQQAYCKFYHDPEDLLVLKNAGVISEEYYRQTICLTQNFSNTSWMYSAEPNEYMRSFGSLSTLDNDLRSAALRKSKKREIAKFKAQVMHDLLLLRACLPVMEE